MLSIGGGLLFRGAALMKREDGENPLVVTVTVLLAIAGVVVLRTVFGMHYGQHVYRVNARHRGHVVKNQVNAFIMYLPGINTSGNFKSRCGYVRTFDRLGICSCDAKYTTKHCALQQ